MKAPVPINALEAFYLAKIIHDVEGEAGRASGDMWRSHLADIAWRDGTFQRMVDNDWEHVWTEEQCQQIMTAWVAYRISR